ncbi:TPA: hypothetical protein ACGZ92_003256 [Elizabethkingia anophelis]
MRKIIVVICFMFSFILWGQRTEKWSIMNISNRSVLTFNINKEESKEFIKNVQAFENVLKQKHGHKFDKFYRRITLVGSRYNPRLLIYLIPNNLNTYENWLNKKYDIGDNKAYQVDYYINKNQISRINYTFILPWGM